jgi:hypothetical protein
VDCDNQIRLVKRNDNPKADSPDFSRVSGPSLVIPIEETRLLDHLLYIA